MKRQNNTGDSRKQPSENVRTQYLEPEDNLHSAKTTLNISDSELSEKQQLAFNMLNNKETEFLLFGGGANGGKSWLGCLWLLQNCLNHSGTRFFIGREELKRLRDSTLITFHKVVKYYGVDRDLFSYNSKDNFFQFTNGSRIDLLDLKYIPSDPLYERYGSLEFTSGWIEEAGEIHFDAFDTLKSRINRCQNDVYGLPGKIFLTCNPKKNWLYQLFYKPHNAGTLPHNMAFIQSLVGDNPYREKGSEEKLKEISNKAKRERLLYGNWDYEDEPDQLIFYNWLEKAAAVKEEPGNGVLGCDVARFGNDSSVFVHFKGNTLAEIKQFDGLRTDVFADEIMKYSSGNSINGDNIGVDVVGLGAGTVDFLKRNGWPVKEINSGESPVKLNKENEQGYTFNNLRSQMWWYCREELSKGEIRIPLHNDQLFEDLTAPRYEIFGERVIKVESKKEIKERINRSPDIGDAFVYANWMRKKRKQKAIETLS